MDPQSSYNDLPWELIVQALQSELSPEEDLRFREWLDLSESNRSQYARLQELWKEGMKDYEFYRSANVGVAWDALREKMGEEVDGGAEEMGAVEGSEKTGGEGRWRIDQHGSQGRIGSEGKKIMSIGRWAAVAAVLLLVAGAGWWYLAGKGSVVEYETAAGEQKTVSLPDGTTVSLNAQTHIELSGDYNKTSRTVMLVSGSAEFKVFHEEQRPFIVDMGVVSVRDIGTRFTIERSKDSINVRVSEGKVAFVEEGTGQTREISAGSSICFYVTERRMGDIRSSDTANGADTLRFDNAPLSDVVTALQQMSGKKILLSDPAIGQKRLTVHLAGESFEDALKTVCASLNLEYTVVNGDYLLKSN